QKSPRCLPCQCFPLWKGIPHLWNEFSSLEGRIFLPFVVYNTCREDFSLFGNLSQLSDNFPQFTQLLGTELFQASLGMEVFLLSQVELKFRNLTVYGQASFLVDREKGSLLIKPLAQLGIKAGLFSGQTISIQGRKELSKEELRQRYMYPSSVKRITGLEESLLTEATVAMHPN